MTAQTSPGRARRQGHPLAALQAQAQLPWHMVVRGSQCCLGPALHRQRALHLMRTCLDEQLKQQGTRVIQAFKSKLKLGVSSL